MTDLCQMERILALSAGKLPKQIPREDFTGKCKLDNLLPCVASNKVRLNAKL